MMREVTVTLVSEHEEDLARLRMHKPSLLANLDDADVLAIVLSRMGALIHQATVVQCPHARHALEHIGLPPEGDTWPAADHDSTPN